MQFTNLASRSCRLFQMAAVLTALSIFAPSAIANGVSYELVTVGNAGNANDTTGYGGVAYEYQIGKYEVTLGQYAAFLNAVAQSSDPNNLWNVDMETNLPDAGIARSGSIGSYTYSVIGPFGSVQIPEATASNRPISHVGWFNSARFANWMSNGRPTGLQQISTTEDGAYDLTLVSGGTAPARNAVNPNTGLSPTFFIPTENEWYKAAYYSPVLNSGSGGYYTYATQSDTAPGNLVGSGNNANYIVSGSYCVTQSAVFDPNQNFLVDVGSFGSAGSYYNTFDQSGNVREWNDLDGVASTVRGLRGGGFENTLASNVSSAQRTTPNASSTIGGFRLSAPVAVPEPSTWGMGLAGLACGACSLLRRTRRN